MLDYVCPICENENRCMINKNEPCWCISYKFTDTANEKLKKLPQRCVCPTCAEKLNESVK